MMKRRKKKLASCRTRFETRMVGCQVDYYESVSRVVATGEEHAGGGFARLSQMASNLALYAIIWRCLAGS
jgi:hypothetical protein